MHGQQATSKGYRLHSNLKIELPRCEYVWFTFSRNSNDILISLVLYSTGFKESITCLSQDIIARIKFDQFSVSLTRKRNIFLFFNPKTEIEQWNQQLEDMTNKKIREQSSILKIKHQTFLLFQWNNYILLLDLIVHKITEFFCDYMVLWA